MPLYRVTLVKGVAEFLATYFINFIGHSVVRDLRNLLYSKIIRAVDGVSLPGIPQAG